MQVIPVHVMVQIFAVVHDHRAGENIHAVVLVMNSQPNGIKDSRGVAPFSRPNHPLGTESHLLTARLHVPPSALLPNPHVGLADVGLVTDSRPLHRQIHCPGILELPEKAHPRQRLNPQRNPVTFQQVRRPLFRPLSPVANLGPKSDPSG